MESTASNQDETICLLLGNKLGLCKNIVDSTQALKAALASGDMARIADNIEKRQEEMAAIEKLDEAIKGMVPFAEANVSPATKIKLNGLESAIHKQLEIAVSLNQICERSAENILELRRTELEQIQNTQQAYGNNKVDRYIHAKFLDVST